MNIQVDYDTNYLCKYKIIHNDLQHLDEDAIIDLEDEMYRNDLMNIFKQTEFNEIFISKGVEQIFNEMKLQNDISNQYENFMDCCEKLANNVMSTDLSIGFLLLFSFDFLYLTHPCVSAFINQNSIPISIVDELMQLV
jgi:hypothetical protein